MIRTVSTIVFFFLILPINVFAQMALPSVFPEMRTINPAVIPMRKSGNTRFSGVSDNIKKVQEVDTYNGAAFNSTEISKINYVDTNFFKGGKGGGFTTELSADFCTGKRSTSVATADSGVDMNFVTKATSTFANLAMGVGNVGVGLTYVGFDSNYSFKQTFSGQTFNNTVNQKVLITGVKPGIVFGGPSLSLGMTAEYNKMKTTVTTGGGEMDSGAPTSMKYLGLAIATGGANSVFEIGVEADPFSKRETDPASQEKIPMAMKVSLLMETKLGAFTLGYKGMAFKGQYIDLDKIIPTQLVYSNPGNDTRLEHVVNFSLGGSSGWSFGGSGSYSNTTKKEKSTIFNSKETYDTKITEMAVSAKISYVY